MHSKLKSLQKKLMTIDGLLLKENLSLKHKTSFANESHTKYYVSVLKKPALKKLIVLFKNSGLEWKKDWDVLGKGSNTLFADQGYGGFIVDISKAFSEFECVESNAYGMTYRVGAGVANIALLNHLRKQKLAGFGYAFGIPGSIGGGVVMNAGTPQGWFGQNVNCVRGYLSDGSSVLWDVSDEDFQYRSFKKKKNLIVSEVDMFFKSSETLSIDAEVAQAKNKRQNQPLDKPNFGSVFKNPLPHYAAQLIEKCQLKGERYGDAQISSKHANFIINNGDAKCSDAVSLIGLIKTKVLKKFGVQLEQEVIVMGDGHAA